MPQLVDIHVPPAEVDNAQAHLSRIARRLGLPPKAISGIELVRRSIDARKRPPVYQMQFRVWVNEQQTQEEIWDIPQQRVDNARPAVIVGFGPAGMFAALRLIERGIKPIVVERGKDVRARRRDLAALNKEGIVNPESNYCFGEGGAGTFSDGKLYTRSHKRGDVRRVLEILVRHGASRDILIDAHPHIGTNKLPQIIAAMRETIESLGGEVHFEKRVDQILVQDGQVQGVLLNGGERILADSVILATGHSAAGHLQYATPGWDRHRGEAVCAWGAGRASATLD
ncbi:MAG: FAD-binding protein [Bacteroidia bacterium]